jgi:hypothetical protein
MRKISHNRRAVIILVLAILVLAIFWGVGSRLGDLLRTVDGRNVPIRFWGRVVDQDGAPLRGVKVKARIRIWPIPGIGEGTFTKRQVTSRADGVFEIRRVSGDVLSIETLEKEGYEAELKAPRNVLYNGSTNFVPNPNSPVEFRMWRAGQVKQQLVAGDKLFTIVPDGRLYTIDLLKGTSEEGELPVGDLRLWVRREAGAMFGTQFEWSFALTAMDGGLVEEPDIYSPMTLAPTDGYGGSYERVLRPSPRGWSYGVGSRRFYTRTRGGQLNGWIDVEIYGFYLKDKQGRLRIRYTVNPSGSNILR